MYVIRQMVNIRPVPIKSFQIAQELLQLKALTKLFHILIYIFYQTFVQLDSVLHASYE